MKRYERVDGEYLGDCQCGCGTPLFERLYLRPSGSIACRSRPRFVRNHTLRVHHCDRTGATDSYPVAEARKALLLPLGAELDATIHRRRRELGLSTREMQVLLGWKGRNNLHRYKYKPNVMPRTLHSVLDKLFANEGGWVEAPPLWRLVHPARKTNNENNANEFFVIIASSYFFLVMAVGKSNSQSVALYTTGQKIGSCAPKIRFTSPLQKLNNTSELIFTNLSRSLCP